MRRTIATALDQRIQQAADTSRWVAMVVGLDYVGRMLAVNIKGASGPRRVIVSNALNLGTALTPLVFVGSQVIVERIDDQYYATALISNPNASTFIGAQ